MLSHHGISAQMTRIPAMNELLDVDDLAKYLKLRKQTIYNWLNQKKISGMIEKSVEMPREYINAGHCTLLLQY